MTSNIGSHHLMEGVSEGGEIPAETRELVFRQLREHFRPKFLNRVDDTILFKALEFEEIKKIVDLVIRDLRKQLEERKVTLELSGEALEMVVREGVDPVYGARPLRRFTQREIETRVARADRG